MYSRIDSTCTILVFITHSVPPPLRLMDVVVAVLCEYNYCNAVNDIVTDVGVSAQLIALIYNNSY